MKAINLYEISSSPAPKEWRKLPEVEKQKPKFPCELALSRLDRDKINIAIWYYRTLESVYWRPYGDPIVIEEA